MNDLGQQPSHASFRTLDTVAPAADRADRQDDPAFTVEDSEETIPAKAKLPLFDRVERILRLVSIICITLSAVLAAWQYVAAQDKETRAQSLVYIGQWQSGTEKDAFAALQRALEPLVASAPALPLSASDDELRQFKGQIGMMLMVDLLQDREATGLTLQEIDRLVDFYSQIQFCIEARICNRALLIEYFGTDIRAFWDYLAPFAEYRRGQHYPHYARAVEALATTLP